MLSVSKKSQYGVKACLALADSFNRGLLQIKDIASRKNIPKQYLEQIFNRLGAAGIVKSVRGKKGGYQLAQPPEKVSVLEIIEVLEGGIQFADPSIGAKDATQVLFQKAENQLKSSLSISLAELHEQQQALYSEIMYHI